jgi:nondiscriminating glutamyl-tRNA synthetase
MKIRTRFAPSPTGYLHIGGLRTALYNYLFAQKNKGNFILRIEDTDQQRYIAGAVDKLINTLQRVGLQPDEGLIAPGTEKGKHKPYIQSQRLNIYQRAADKLIKNNWAYYCFCSTERLEKLREEQQTNKQVPKYDGHCRHLTPEEIKQRLANQEKYVIRFRLPEDQIIKAEDLIHGQISVKSQDLDDFVLLKSDGYATYHLANVVDDQAMEITHVIRGDEWLPSLPKHILLYQALGYKLPIFVHVPLLRNPDKSKLSKRQGDVAVEDFLDKGYLPEALVNYVALLGWNPGTEQEIFMINDLIKQFSLEKLNKSGAIFDLNKLNWYNAAYIRLIIEQAGERYGQLLQQVAGYLPEHPDKAKKMLQLFGSRLNYLGEITELSKFFFTLPDYSKEMLIFKKSDLQKTQNGLGLALGSLDKIPHRDWQQKNINNTLETIAQKHGLAPGDIFWPVRVAVSGLEKSPSPAEIIEALGKEEALNRIKIAIKKLN